MPLVAHTDLPTFARLKEEGEVILEVDRDRMTFSAPRGVATPALLAALKAHKTDMRSLASIGHDPGDLLKAMDLARDYGKALYTGVFYRNPQPGPTFEAEARHRHETLRSSALPKEKILELFRPH